MHFWLMLVLAQQLPTSTLPSTLPPDATPLPVAGAKAPASATPPAAAETTPVVPVKLTYEGKPLMVASSCNEETIPALGLGCTLDEPCQVFLELSGLEVAGNTVVMSGNIHTDLVTIDSVLLVSEDGGKNWTEPHARIRQGVLEQIQFIDFQNGWAAGQVMQTFARDPFLMITNDGGKSWRRRAMFDDARPGSIEYFHFTSKTQGTLVLDRSKSGDPNVKYESFESSTGGSSWQIREVSKTVIKPKRPLPGNGDWRLRADGALKAFRVEKRTGARWETVSSFTIRLKDCAPPEPKVVPEPVVEEAPPAATAPAKKTAGPPTLKKK
jgi:hypothetical protein